MMLGNFIMISGIGLLSIGFFIRRKQNYFKELFKQIQQSKKYHLDFVDQLNKLPTDKNLILFGVPKSETQKDRILCKSIIKRGKIEPPKQDQQKKEFQFPKEDRLWKFQLKEPFYLQTLSNQKIDVQKEKDDKLYAFNLLRRNYNEKWQERVIVKNEPICVYGKMSKVNQRMIMNPYMILGTKNQSFLSYLDDEILRLRSRGKYFTIGGCGVFAFHIIFKQLFGDSKIQKQNIQKSSKEKTQGDNIIKQISNFQKQKR